MLQEASRRGPEIVQARTDATLADVTAERETKWWRTWLPVLVANLICLAVHWFVSTTEPPVETRSYFVFLWNFLAVALLLAIAQLWLPALRRRMRQMGPIFAGALLTLCGWELITSGFHLLPLPYFPGPAAVFQSLINDRALLFDSTWHSLILLLGGYALDGDKPVFLEAGDLAREGVEFAVARENARRQSRRQRREHAFDEIVRVGRKRDGRGIGQREPSGDAALHARNQIAKNNLPFVVGESRGIAECPAMGRAGCIRPEMMTVRCQMNAPGLRATKLAEMAAQIERHRPLGPAAYR